MNAIASAILDAAVRGAVVLVAALALTHLLRRRSAAARHLVWVGAIVVQLLLPLFALWDGRPQWNVAIPSAVANVMPVEIARAPAARVDVTMPAPTTQRDNSSQPLQLQLNINQPAPTLDAGRQTSLSNPAGAPAPAVTGKQLLLVLWIAGAVLIIIRLIVGTSMVAALARKGARVDDGNWLSLAQRLSNTLGIDRPLTLLRGQKLGVPVTWGIVYPIVLLPDDADSWTEERRRFVLVHEMAHVKRLDALTQLAGQFALALFWFNPLVWVANRRMQMEREHACDDYVIRHGTTPSMYAEELLSMVRSLGTSDRTAQPAFAALAMARRSEFEGRMLSILDPVLDRHPLARGRAVTGALAAMVLVVPLAALHPYQRVATPPVVHEARTPVPPATKPVAANDLPESFKVSIGEPVMPGATSVVANEPLVKPMRALAAGVAQLGEGMKSSASIATTLKLAAGCDSYRPGSSSGGESMHLHAEDGEHANPIIDLTKKSANKCSSATIVGVLKYTVLEDDILEMPFGSNAAFRERTATEDRELVVTRTQDGAVQHLFRLDGQSAPWDETAQRWFAAYLPTVLADAGVNVSARVARWRAEGGVTAVLEHINRMSSSSAKRSHYEALLTKGEKLVNDDLDRVVRSASAHLASSSSDLRAVLSIAAPNVRLSKQGISAVEAALRSMTSSGDKSAVLQMYGQTDDRDMLLGVMRVAQTIMSSGDKARLLQVLAPRYLGKEDRDLESAYFGNIEKIPSPGDQRNTLMISISYAAKSPAVAKQIIHAARTVDSSGDRSAVLISLVSNGALVTKELRDQFFVAAGEVPSEGDRSRVLQAAAASAIR